MALMSDGTDYYQLIDCMYKCKRFKSFRSRHFKDRHHHILGYRFENEILILEQIKESQQREHLSKYNNKRCNCKVKKISVHESISYGCFDNKKNKNNTKTSHFREINCSSEICASMVTEIWQRPQISPMTIRSKERSVFSRQWLSACASSQATQAALSLESKSVAAFSPPNTISCYPLIYDSFHWIRTETKTKSCDIPSNYLKKNLNSKINLLNYKKNQSQTQKLYHNYHLQSSYHYLLMMFVMVVKEIVRYASESMYRMRRKTQYLLPILILLQLLMSASLTNCTSPLNQTVATVVSASSSTPYLSSVALVSDNINTPLEESVSSTSNTKSSLAPSKISAGKEIHREQTIRQYQVSAAATGSLHRPSGGSSIASYLNHEGQLRRDPTVSFTSTGCHSCQMREQVKADNLESIKRHILLRLEMQTLPNITAPPVPRTIIENFYKNHSYFENKKSEVLDNESSTNGRSSLVSTTLSLLHSNGYINSGERAANNDNNMQGDDPTTYSEDYIEGGKEDDEHDEHLYKNNSEDEFFSIVNSVYVFPTMPRMRHNRKAEILNFQLKSSEHSTVSQALLHVYIRGRDWIREYEPDVLDAKNFIGEERREIVITINRVIRRVNSTIATHTVNVTESQHEIPSGLGKWITIDITELVQSWLRNTTTNQGIVIKGSEAWMKAFIITGDSPNSKAFTVYIEMLTKDNRKRRTKRNTSMNCSETDNEERCCRYPLVVNFVEFEWTWVVAPTSFNAYFCNGECKLGFLEKYPHTHLMQLSTAPQPCCSPTKMSPLRLLYFNSENTLVMSTIPNMAVEKCSCS